MQCLQNATPAHNIDFEALGNFYRVSYIANGTTDIFEVGTNMHPPDKVVHL